MVKRGENTGLAANGADIFEMYEVFFGSRISCSAGKIFGNKTTQTFTICKVYEIRRKNVKFTHFFNF